MLTPAGRAIAAAFVVSGTAHVVRPQLFDPLMPPRLPAPRAWVVGTGVAELAAAAGLVAGARWAPAATVATLGVVWPGNWWYAIATQRHPGRSGLHRGVAWARVPLQVPLMVAAARPYRPSAR